ncbi:MAG: HU family DNA-binding protein [Mediterranea sp.]|jgi:predicted histone-like DNA-binding protein|nr:HU family DNA-binding protein [Mediterranea sp.]
MPILYGPVLSTFANKDGKKLYNPRVKHRGKATTEELAGQIAKRCSLTVGDVKSALDELPDVMAIYLQASQSVTIDGLGTFRINLRSNGRGSEDPAKVRANRSKLVVCFQPAFTRNENGGVGKRSLIDGAKCMRLDSDTIDDDNTGTGTGGGSEIPEAPEPMV